MRFNSIVIFKQYIPKKHNIFGIKIHRLCNSKVYMYGMPVYLGKNRQCVNPSMTTTCATVIGLPTRLENVGHRLYGQFLYLVILRQYSAAGLLDQKEKGC